MAFDMPAILKIRLKADCPTHSRTEISARQHKVLIDEPPSRNGTDLAQSPLETLLSSFLGCTNVVANVIAEEMGIVITEMELESSVRANRTNLQKAESYRFQAAS